MSAPTQSVSPRLVLSSGAVFVWTVNMTLTHRHPLHCALGNKKLDTPMTSCIEARMNTRPTGPWAGELADIYCIKSAKLSSDTQFCIFNKLQGREQLNMYRKQWLQHKPSSSSFHPSKEESCNTQAVFMYLQFINVVWGSIYRCIFHS